jgi:hypothetical protein
MGAGAYPKGWPQITTPQGGAFCLRFRQKQIHEEEP